MNWKKICAVLVAVVALGVNPLSARELEKGEWYVRLILKSDAEGLEDPYNQLGQLNDALPGLDTYDLPELDQPSGFIGPYLSVIFYRPDWETEAETFNTDYHPISSRKESDEWTFEVRSNTSTRYLNLTWVSGTKTNRMNKMVLVDLQNNVMVAAVIDGVPQEYSFEMNAYVREFAWRLLTNKQYKEFVATGEVSTSLVATDEASTSFVTTDQVSTSNDTKKSEWLPRSWGQGEGKGYDRKVPEGLPDDPFGD
jgi:hypothetical protein